MQGECRYTASVSWWWTWSFPYGKDYSNKDYLHTLEVCSMSNSMILWFNYFMILCLLQKGTLYHIMSYHHTVFYRIISSLQCMFIWSYYQPTYYQPTYYQPTYLLPAHLLPAHSDFPAYFSLYGHCAWEPMGFIITSLTLCFIRLYESRSTSLSLLLILSHSSSPSLFCSTADLVPQICIQTCDGLIPVPPCGQAEKNSLSESMWEK